MVNDCPFRNVFHVVVKMSIEWKQHSVSVTYSTIIDCKGVISLNSTIVLLNSTNHSSLHCPSVYVYNRSHDSPIGCCIMNVFCRPSAYSQLLYMQELLWMLFISILQSSMLNPSLLCMFGYKSYYTHLAPL